MTQRANIQENISDENENIELNIYEIAHDIRGIVARTGSITNLLFEKLIDNEDKEIKDLLTMLLKVNSQGDTMLKDFIFFNELEKKKNYSETLKRTEITELIETQLEPYKVICKSRGIQLEIQIDTVQAISFVNENDIRRVIDNILSNALKFTYSGGQIKVSFMKAGLKGVLKIIDDGIGIPEKTQSELFVSYSKARRIGILKENSTGLGLFIAKKIMEMNNGTVSICSTENVGTACTITFNLSS